MTTEDKHRFYIGDLVQFVHNHLNVTNLRTGLIVGYSDKKGRFKVKTETRDFWVVGDKLKLLSKVQNKVKKNEIKS